MSGRVILVYLGRRVWPDFDRGGRGPPPPPDIPGWSRGWYLATKPKVMGIFGLGRIELITPKQKNGFRGVRGGGGGAFWALFRAFLTPFFYRWSDKKVHKTKNVGKGHISIPRAKGFDVRF